MILYDLYDKTAKNAKNMADNDHRQKAITKTVSLAVNISAQGLLQRLNLRFLRKTKSKVSELVNFSIAEYTIDQYTVRKGGRK